MLSLLDDEIRDCLEGAVPLAVATCAPDGTVNVTYASHAHVADAQHIALSFISSSARPTRTSSRTRGLPSRS